MADVPDVRIDAGDAMELGQLLDFLASWFSRDDPRLTVSYIDFVGHDAADVTEVRDILARLAFLLGEDDDGQRLFGRDPD
jgi:hypothetical protein